MGRNWEQIGADIDGRATTGWFGSAVAMSQDGNTIIVGSPGSYRSGTAGYAQVFTRTGDHWVQVGADLTGGAAGDRFGASVAMNADGTIVALGASGGGSPARVFQLDRDALQWVRLGADINPPIESGSFGASIALSADGRTVAIGDPGATVAGGSYAGYVQMYQLDDELGEWLEIREMLAGYRYNYLGRNVALSADGSTILTSMTDEIGDGDVEGSVSVDSWVGDRWESLGMYVISSPSSSRTYGSAFAMSADGLTIAVGDPAYRTPLAHVLTYDGTRWVQVGSYLYGDAGDDFGRSLALSADGNTLVVGSLGDDARSGSATVFSFDGTDWAQLGSPLQGEAAGDEAGVSLAINHDGTQVLVGSPFNDAGGDDAGSVAIYELVRAETASCGGLAATIDMTTNGGNGIGTSGDDVIVGTSGDDVIDGRGGNDTICGRRGDDRINGGSGNDRVLGGLGDDRLFGDQGLDVLNGGPGDDIIKGGSGKDHVIGGPGNDRLVGGANNDRLVGERGDDTLRGGPGNDDLNGGRGTDSCNGGRGVDTTKECEGDEPLPACATGGAYADVVARDGAIHYWRLEELTTSELACDQGLVGGNDGTFAGGISLGHATPNRGSAALFDGASGTFVDVGLFHAGDMVSVEAWVLLDSTASKDYHSAVSRWDGSYELDVNELSDRGNFVARNDSNEFGLAQTGSPVSRDVWHHMVGVFDDAGNLTVYLDGVRGSTVAMGGVLQDAGDVSVDRVLIGATRNGTTLSFNWTGLIDEVAIYDYPLTPAQIAAHYAAG